MLPCELRPSARQIVDHANSLGLSVERVEALSTQPDTGVGRALGQIFFGSYEPSYVERFVLAAPDGLRWVYVQPYSSDAVMPGEHHFALWGSPPASLWAAGSSWIDRNRQLILRLAILACATIVGLPLGVILFVLLIPRAPRVHGAELAVAINRTPQLQRLRYSGGPFSRDFLIPWALQLQSVGSGSSRLVCVDPGTV
ncbi:MAG: hypothetical protein IT378_01460, partial [Sandaracinaceae bacterium]|nr:hypothetical protein [Sandaracinaceae bacterium]